MPQRQLTWWKPRYCSTVLEAKKTSPSHDTTNRKPLRACNKSSACNGCYQWHIQYSCLLEPYWLTCNTLSVSVKVGSAYRWWLWWDKWWRWPSIAYRSCKAPEHVEIQRMIMNADNIRVKVCTCMKMHMILSRVIQIISVRGVLFSLTLEVHLHRMVHLCFYEVMNQVSNQCALHNLCVVS